MELERAEGRISLPNLPQEFFKPANFVRSTSLGALKQGVALAVGYWCAPPATKFFNGLIASLKAGYAP